VRRAPPTHSGRGGSQVTGHEGYDKLGQKLGLDLLYHPDLVNDPANFLECAVADFILCGCLLFARNDDIDGVTYHLNGGYNGLAERKSWLAKWKAALTKPGAEPPLTADGSYGPMTTAAVRMFQQQKGLDADGKIGPLTIAAIERALA
jgi:putative chitinase